MTTAALAVILVLIAVPHVLDLRRADPSWAAGLWLAGLLSRAAGTLAALAWLAVLLPRTDAFAAVTHWCWHAVVPYVAAHLSFTGHRVGDLALLVPVLAVATSAVAAAYGIARAATAVRKYLRRFAIGPGPGGSVIVPGPEILLAAAGIARPQVLVSAGALIRLDDSELAVGLEHERAHIERRHRWLLLAGTLARAIGRPLPGGSTALRELSFHLERDADRWALRQVDDRLALASVICKAATAAAPAGAVTSLAGPNVASRVRELLDERSARPRSRRSTAARLLGLCLVAALIGTAAPAPSALALPANGTDVRHCPG